MYSTAVVALFVVVCGADGLVQNGSRYGFFRSMGDGGMWGDASWGTRRVFGGSAAELNVYPETCALLDRYWTARCSGAVVAPRWVLTAAHCVSPRVAYVKYNARRPSSPEGNVVPVHYLYRHPKYKVVQEDEGRGMDVTLLHHDVGLVRTRADMRLSTRSASDPLVSMRLYNPVDLKNQEIEVMGFGRTERATLGEELFSVKLNLVFCERGAWFHCVCGIATGSDQRGVCSGDSGGPVIYRGVQVGVTSMGPLECARAGGPIPTVGATSVFTSLYNYANLINATIHETDEALHMTIINHSPTPFTPDLSAFLAVPLLRVLLPAR